MSHLESSAWGNKFKAEKHQDCSLRFVHSGDNLYKRMTTYWSYATSVIYAMMSHFDWSSAASFTDHQSVYIKEDEESCLRANFFLHNVL